MRTFGEYCYLIHENHKKNNKTPLDDDSPSNPSGYVEFDEIWKTQSRFYPEIL